jgi:hypothetical protein
MKFSKKDKLSCQANIILRVGVGVGGCLFYTLDIHTHAHAHAHPPHTHTHDIFVVKESRHPKYFQYLLKEFSTVKSTMPEK